MKEEGATTGEMKMSPPPDRATKPPISMVIVFFLPWTKVETLSLLTLMSPQSPPESGEINSEEGKGAHERQSLGWKMERRGVVVRR
ncbi:hypothetical protein PIB30_094874, partial [Stylosanthes scabra]|nr:hypothetical protein [Stylosanthes scabra]